MALGPHLLISKDLDFVRCYSSHRFPTMKEIYDFPLWVCQKAFFFLPHIKQLWKHQEDTLVFSSLQQPPPALSLWTKKPHVLYNRGGENIFPNLLNGQVHISTSNLSKGPLLRYGRKELRNGRESWAVALICAAWCGIELTLQENLRIILSSSSVEAPGFAVKVVHVEYHRETMPRTRHPNMICQKVQFCTHKCSSWHRVCP